jgi:hypothetical protein
MFCRGIEQKDTPVIRSVGCLQGASDRVPSEIGNPSVTRLGKSCIPVPLPNRDHHVRESSQPLGKD